MYSTVHFAGFFGLLVRWLDWLRQVLDIVGLLLHSQILVTLTGVQSRELHMQVEQPEAGLSSSKTGGRFLRVIDAGPAERTQRVARWVRSLQTCAVSPPLYGPVGIRHRKVPDAAQRRTDARS